MDTLIDFSPVDFWFADYFKSRMYLNSPSSLGQLKEAIIQNHLYPSGYALCCCQWCRKSFTDCNLWWLWTYRRSFVTSYMLDIRYNVQNLLFFTRTMKDIFITCVNKREFFPGSPLIIFYHSQLHYNLVFWKK